MLKTIIKKSIAASFLISIGVAVLFSSSTFGPFLFSLGLLAICCTDMYLFTGKCGYTFTNSQTRRQILPILIVNLISGWIFGFLLSFTNKQFTLQAIEKINSWDWSIGSFIQAFYCGGIMYICVELYKRKEKLGILYGIPVFIFSGFQHCIANIITLGIAKTFNDVIFLHIIGNFFGAITFNWLLKNK